MTHLHRWAGLLLGVGGLLVAWSLILMLTVHDDTRSDTPVQVVLVVGLMLVLAGAAGLSARHDEG